MKGGACKKGAGKLRQMLNHIVLVGRVIELPEVKETSHGNKVATVGLEMDRPFKSAEGIYEKDIVTITLWKGIAETVSEVCQIGDILAVKGRIQSRNYEKEGNVYRNYEFIAEKVSFISSGAASGD